MREGGCTQPSYEGAARPELSTEDEGRIEMVSDYTIQESYGFDCDVNIADEVGTNKNISKRRRV